MNSIVASLDRVVSDLDQVLGAVVDSEALLRLSSADRMEVLRHAGDVFRRIEAVVVETVAACGSEFATEFGCRNMNEVLQRVMRLDAPSAARVVKAAKTARREVDITSGAPLPARWPALREAMLDGAVGVSGLLAASGPIEQAGTRIGHADRLRADAELAAQARGYVIAGAEPIAPDAVRADADRADGPPATPDDLRQYAQLIALYLDPDGSAPTDARASHLRSLTVGRLRDGVYPIRGNLLPEVCAQLQLIFDAQLNPKTDGRPDLGVRFRPSEGLSGANELDDSDDLPDTTDSRTRPQKQHDALAAALGIAARHDDMPRLGGAAPTLVVHVDATALAAGAGWASVPGLDAPIPAAAAAHTACAGGIQRVLFDEGRVIGISSTDRVFTLHQRRAITLRDKKCVIPGCHVPASWCEIHHVTEHARGGPTHTDNGVPLCWHHHRTLDTSGWEIRMNGGIPQVRGPGWWDPLRRWRMPRSTIEDFTAARA